MAALLLFLAGLCYCTDLSPAYAVDQGANTLIRNRFRLEPGAWEQWNYGNLSVQLSEAFTLTTSYEDIGGTYGIAISTGWFEDNLTIEGSNTSVTAGDGITVTGVGTTGDPYVVVAKPTAPIEIQAGEIGLNYHSTGLSEDAGQLYVDMSELVDDTTIEAYGGTSPSYIRVKTLWLTITTDDDYADAPDSAGNLGIMGGTNIGTSMSAGTSPVDQQVTINLDQSIDLSSVEVEHLYLKDDAGGGGYHYSVYAPDIAEDLVWTFPPTDGNNGEVLTTDGSGGTSWAADSEGHNVYVFGESGLWQGIFSEQLQHGGGAETIPVGCSGEIVAVYSYSQGYVDDSTIDITVYYGPPGSLSNVSWQVDAVVDTYALGTPASVTAGTDVIEVKATGDGLGDDNITEFTVTVVVEE